MTLQQEQELTARTVALYREARAVADKYRYYGARMPPLMARVLAAGECVWHGANNGEITPCCLHQSERQ